MAETAIKPIDIAIDIISRTDDGNRLYMSPGSTLSRGDGWQLKLLEMACNGFLNDEGIKLLEALQRQVRANDFWYSLLKFKQRFLTEGGQ